MKVTPSDETATYYCIHSEASLLGIPTATLLRQIASLDDLDERLHTGTEEFTIAETLTPVTSLQNRRRGYDGRSSRATSPRAKPSPSNRPQGLRPSPSGQEKSFDDNTVIDITPAGGRSPLLRRGEGGPSAMR